MNLNTSLRDDNQIIKQTDNEQDKNRWLHGTVESDDWFFIEFMPGQYDSRMKMSWNPSFNQNSISADIGWKNWKQFGKDFCCYYFDEVSLGKNSSFIVYARLVKAICQYFCFTRQCLNIEKVTKGDINAFEVYLSNKDLSISYVAEQLRILKSFWAYRQEVGSGLEYCPYMGKNLIKQKSKRLGSKNGHTKTIKPDEAFLLLNHALQLVENSSDVLLRYARYIEIKKKFGSNSSKKYKKEFGSTATSLINECWALYGAAVVLILTLSAMRKHESNTILYEDAKLLLSGEIDTLRGVVHKTSGTITGKNTERQIVAEVQEAINVITQLTEPMRKLSGSPYLLLRLTLTDSVQSGTTRCNELATKSMYKILDSFSTDAGYSGQLRPHMFRRFFSMLWAWRFEVGDLHYLSKLLYHNGYKFTTAYTEDEDVWEFMPENMKKFTHDVFDKMLHGKKQIVGGFSRTIESYKKLIQSKVSLVNSDDISTYIDAVIERSGYIVTPAADGYCFMTPNRAKFSKCSTVEGIPNYSNRRAELCSQCSNFGVTIDHVGRWENRYQMHEKVFNSTDNENTKKQSKAGMEITLKMLNKLKV
jgi:site-specific recombinase XerD